MMELILFGSIFFGNDPEQMLFMMYTLLFIWTSAMRTVAYPPLFAPHIMDIVAAKAEAEASAEVSMTANTTTAVILPKFCGRTIGDIAATCGISLAVSAYFDSRRMRLRISPSQWLDKETKKILRKKLRRTLSYVMGVTVNFIADIEEWWESRSLTVKLSNDSTATADAEL